MNARLFRLVFNTKLGMVVPAHETARARGKAGTSSGVTAATLTLASLLAAGPAPAQLPVPCGGGACGTNPNPTAFVTGGAASYAVQGTRGIVHQTTDKAILNWQSHNVGRGFSMEYLLPSADAATLSRIWQSDASAIAGALKSNGQLYLLNQNGILFANGAQVNVGGLVASALDMDDAVFLHPNGLFSRTDDAGRVSPAFQWRGTAAEFSSTLIRVKPDARLEAALGGAIMLFGPRVINQGEIHTQEGQTVLAAGGKVYLSAPPGSEGLKADSPYRGLAGMLVEVDPFEEAVTGTRLSGQVINDAMGRIITERGNATLAALAVNQSGRVTATTSVTHKGSVRLLARERMTYDQNFLARGANVITASETGKAELGANSVTEVLPELASEKSINDSQTFNPSTVEVMGSRIVLDQGARVVVPGGHVSLSAQADGSLYQGGDGADNGHRIYMAPGSLIDVSGVEDVDIAMARNFIEVELRGTELRDNPLNRNGYLRGNKVWVDIRNLPDKDLADVSGYVDQVGRGIGEKLSAGGSASMRSEGDIVLRQGSAIDLSGGSLNYQSGYATASQLISQGQVFDIGDAPADRLYDGIVGQYSYTDPKWGVTRTITLPLIVQYHEGYVQGQNAGSLSLEASALAMDGSLIARTITGPFQRRRPSTDGTAPTQGQLPALGRLVIGNASQAGVANGDMKIPDVLLSGTSTTLPGKFTANTALAANRWDTFVLSTGMLRDSGVGHVEVYSNGKIIVAPDGGLDLPAYGSATLVGGAVDVQAGIQVAGGSMHLASQLTTTTDLGETGIRVGDGVVLSVAGVWTNDTLPDADINAAVVLDGGDITLRSVTGLALGAGSLLDANSGGWYGADHVLEGGTGGDITLLSTSNEEVLDLMTPNLLLRGELRAWGMNRGGTLTLRAPALTLGTTRRGVAGELLFSPDDLNQAGFGAYALEGVNSVVLQSGAQLHPRQRLLALNLDFATRISGQALAGMTHVERPPEDYRQAVDVSLKSTHGSPYLADGTPTGWLAVEAGSRLELEAGGELDLSATQHQLQVHGRLVAPAGQIRLTMRGNPGEEDSDPGYDPSQAIWIGHGAVLDAGGAVVSQPGNDGLNRGQVLDGGTIRLTSHKGYVVAQSGARLDVSGAAAQLDVAVPTQRGFTYLRQRVASSGGAILVQAREGAVLDAAMAASAPGSVGGALTVTLDRAGVDPELRVPPYPGTTSGNPASYPSIDPDRRWKIVLSDIHTPLADALNPGDAIDGVAPGRVRLGASQLENAGFASLHLNAEHAVAFEGNPNLGMNRVMNLNAPVLESDGGRVDLAAAYVGLGNTTRFVQRQVLETPLPGTGQLKVSARHIDLHGYLSLQGIEQAHFTSAGDIRAVGVIADAALPYPTGALGAAGTINFTARQVYPATLTEYVIHAQGAGSRVIFNRNGTPGPVLSAAGSLVVQADDIMQRGVVKAPFGEIALQGTNSVTLDAGSLTSVSGEGQVIPLGSTVLTGRKWVYQVNGLSRELSAPDKAVVLSAPAVAVKKRATLDVSGGGDLLAQEWIPGLGGSMDVLDSAHNPDTYAILPGYGNGFAPQDPQYDDDATQPLAGQSIHLAGVTGLKDGYYTLLPARYALLPGAYAITPVPGQLDMVPGQNHVQADGAAIVAGQGALLTHNGALVNVGRRGAYRVQPGDLIRGQSEYLSTAASAFLSGSGGLLPGDAGRVSIEASGDLIFAGNLAADHDSGRRGAQVDLSAPRLAVVSDGAPAMAGYLTLEVGMLNALKAESLLLGGTRTQTALGTWARVGASEILLANDVRHPLAGSEVLLAATERVTLADGATLRTRGTAADAPRRLTLGHAAHADLDINQDGFLNDADALALGADLNADGLHDLDDVAIHALGNGLDYLDESNNPRQANRGDLAAVYAIGDLDGDNRMDFSDLAGVSGDGALLAVASAGGLEIVRQSVGSQRGVLDVAADASISGHAVILDATLDNLAAAQPTLLDGGQLDIGAGRISFGAPAIQVPGLVFAQEDLKALLAGVGDLTLRSYSTLDIHGNLDMQAMFQALRLANPNLAMPRLRLESAGIAGYGGDAVLAAGRLELNNRSGNGFSTPGQLVPGAGSLTLQADTLSLGDGVFRIAGYTSSTVIAQGALQAQGEGSLKADGDLTLATPRITANDGAVYAFEADGMLRTVRRSPPQGFRAESAGVVASLAFSGASVVHGSIVETPSGTVTFTATDGDLTLVDGGQVLARGQVVGIHDESFALPGGAVRMVAEAGNVVMDDGSLVDVSADGADAGSVEVSARSGHFRVEGELRGRAQALRDVHGNSLAPAGEGATFRLDTLALFDAGAPGGGDDLSAINSALGQGFRGEQVLRLRSGDLEVAATDTLRAGRVELTADNGGIRVLGTLDASGDKGGEIGLYAKDDLILDAGGKLLALGLADTESTAGTLGRGGTVILSSSAGTLATEAGSMIDVTGDRAGMITGGGGRVWLRAPRTGNGAGTDLAISALDGQILGAREILAEGVKVYDGFGKIDIGTTSGIKLGFDSLNTENNIFMSKAAAIASRLDPTGNPAFRVTPGVEVRSAGNLEVSRDWNLFKSSSATLSISRPVAVRTSQAMVLTLRAAGDLVIKGSINDGFWIGNSLPNGEKFDQSKHSAYALQAGPSSAYNFVAGADTQAANPFAYAAGNGNFSLAAGKFIRTGAGDIRIAAGGNVVLEGAKSVIYTAGIPGPAVPGFDRLSPAGFPTAYPNQVLKAIYPTQGGDIHIRAGGDIEDRNTLATEAREWQLRYQDADIDLATGQVYLNRQPSYFPRFDLFKRGIGTLGGGDIDVAAAGDVVNLWLFAPTNARQGGDRSAAPDAANLAQQGGGDVRLRAGGDITGAQVMVQEGQGRLVAGLTAEVGFTAGDARISVYAPEKATILGFVDPLLQDAHGNNTPPGVGADNVNFVVNSGAPTSRLDVLSVLEGISLANATHAYPGTLAARTPLGGVVIQDGLTMLPHATGQLVLAAGRDVVFEGGLVMSDYSPDQLPNLTRPGTSQPDLSLYESFLNHAPGLLHLGDRTAARIYALAGDILGVTEGGSLVELVLPKAAHLKAGRDVKDLSMVIQNVHSDDMSSIRAGRDIRLPDGFNVADGSVSSSNHAMAVAGPGYLMLQAGRDVDLGSSEGVLSIGNEFNPYLDKQGADLMIMAGLGIQDGGVREPHYQAFANDYLAAGSKALNDLRNELGYRARKDVAVTVLAEHPELDPDNAADRQTIDAYLDGHYAARVTARQHALWSAFEAMPLEARVTRVFFNELQAAGEEFNAAPSPKVAQDAQRGFDAVASLFPTKAGSEAITYAGNVNFYFSQVRSNRGGNVEIFAPGGLVNVGLASSGELSKSEAELGLFTIRGGDIRAYVHDDFLVNQSRVFTLGGGAILLWSDVGDIDAGKGAKTAAAAPPPQLRVENGRIFFDITSSVAGSGIGTINTSRANPRDDGHLIAPNGEINAGDAGIRSAGNLSIAAVRVVGADNIQVGGISTGVPVADTSGLSSGLSGVSGLNESAGATSEATRSMSSSAKDGEENAQATRQLLASFKPTFISVEVLGFGEGTASLGGQMDEAERKRREMEKRGPDGGA